MIQCLVADNAASLIGDAQGSNGNGSDDVGAAGGAAGANAESSQSSRESSQNGNSSMIAAGRTGLEPGQARSETSHHVAIGEIGGADGVQDATDKHASTRARDDSRTIPATPRAALIAALADGVKGAIAAGDLEAARVAYEALGELIGGADDRATSLIDLRTVKDRRR